MKNFIALFFAISCLRCFAQLTAPPTDKKIEFPSIISPSPTVANLMHFEEVPVDNHTGQPDISIPLYSKQLSNDLILSLVLKYNTLGVRTEERSGWIGTGWSLESGGTISRTVRSVPDETQGTPQNKYSTGVSHNSQFWNYNSLSDAEKNLFLWNANGTKYIKYDTEPDLYQFSFLGISGRFIIHNGEVRLLTQDQKLDIVANFNSGLEVTSFVITDANGYKYKFNVCETSTTELVTFVYKRGNNDGVAPNRDFAQTITSAWHLSEITTSDTQDLLAKFSYIQSTENYKTPLSRTYYNFKYLDLAQAGMYNQPLENSYNLQYVFKPEKITSQYIVSTLTQKLSKIEFKDKSTLNFTLTNEDTHPEHGGRYLNKISLNRPNTTLSDRTFNLNYQFTQTDPGSEDTPRLWLTEVNTNNTQKYKLEYFQKNGLPDVNHPGDAWGYNNGDFRKNIDSGFNYYDFEAYKRGLLTKIIYPTGGSKEFSWSPHTFSYEGNKLIENFDDNPRNSTNDSLSHNFTVSQSATIASTNIYIDHDQYIRVLKNITSSTSSVGQIDMKNYITYFTAINNTPSNNSTSKRFNEIPGFVYLKTGTYKITVRNYPGTDIRYQSLSGFLNIQYTKLKTGPIYSKYLLGGGVRISSVIFKENPSVSDFLKIKTYNYHDNADFDYDLIGKSISTGAVDSQVGNMLKNYDLNDKKYMFTGADRYPSALQERNILYNVITNEPNMQLTKGNYVSYKKVRVFDDRILTSPANGFALIKNGHTEYVYTSVFDFPSPQDSFTYPFVTPPNLDFKRGLLLHKTVFDKDGRKVEEIINDSGNYDIGGYQFTEDFVSNSFIVKETACIWRQCYEKYENYLNPQFAEYKIYCEPEPLYVCLPHENCGTPAPYAALFTNLTAGRAELKESIKREFFYNGTVVDSIDTRYTYNYNPHNYQLSEETQHVNEGNVTNLYKTKYFYPVDDSNYSITSLFTQDEKNVITAMKNNYNMVNKPVITTTYKNNQVLQNIVNKYKIFSSSTPLPAGAASLPNYPLLYQVESIKKYGTLPAEDRLIYKLYDKSGNPLEFSMADGMNVCYIWGYYKTVPIAKIENATYDEIRVALSINTIDNVMALNENNMAQINNLRALLPKAMVTTLVYDVISGVTSVTDPKGYTTNYIYDNLGRLAFVTDHNEDIISKNNYNYRP